MPLAVLKETDNNTHQMPRVLCSFRFFALCLLQVECSVSDSVVGRLQFLHRRLKQSDVTSSSLLDGLMLYRVVVMHEMIFIPNTCGTLLVSLDHLNHHLGPVTLRLYDPIELSPPRHPWSAWCQVSAFLEAYQRQLRDGVLPVRLILADRTYVGRKPGPGRTVLFT